MNKLTLSYLTLSFLSGFIELGIIILIIGEGRSFFYIPIMALAYQMGALFREPLKLSPLHYCLAIILSFIPAFFVPKSYIFLFISVFLLSIGIQGLRGMISECTEVSTFIKRTSRVLGFSLSGFLSENILPIISGIIVIIILIIAKDLNWSQEVKIQWKLKSGTLGLIMIIHQSHYFSYAYMIPLLLVMNFSLEPKITGIFFCVGWLSYILSKKFLGEKRLSTNFALGHLFVSIILLFMYFYSTISLIVFLILWFLTGFGGGTVYCLRKLRAKSSKDQSDMDSWENLGHVFGLLICLIILRLSVMPTFLFITASFLAISTFILFLLTQHQRYKRKTNI